MIAFEHIPPEKDGKEVGLENLGEFFFLAKYLYIRGAEVLTKFSIVLHQDFLGLFGLNIGELWDLEALSRTCTRERRYFFLLTSCPLNVPGSAGSPPNALAIFQKKAGISHILSRKV